ncbi:MAG: RNase adapter RapZ [Alphaproteobacteria bacterium]|nr:RNase adapter RapZ [Alphaproteobacteria bacterium]
MHKNPLLIVTGLSGAGLATVLKTLEDFGFEAFDNLPLSLLPNLLKSSHAPNTPIAIGIDTRSREFDVQTLLDTAKHHDAKLLFVTCDNTVLHKRFTETRRRHPLAADRPVALGIAEERAIMDPLRENADIVIDTSQLSIHDLRHILEGHFKPDNQKDLIISLMSFGFRGGIPREADIVMDVRFLQNPHWVKDLKPKTGKDKDVGDYIKGDKDFETFIENFKSLLEPLIPRYAHEGKSYLTIAIGCTGGRHRSVFTVETLGQWLKGQSLQTHIEHRDLKD